MSGSIQRFRTFVSGAAVAGALGFGASHARAEPARDPGLPVCVFAECAARCIVAGHDGGTCLTTRSCICYDFSR